jgi:hypothetical protein
MYQYSETNVMHFLLNLSRIKGPYTFRALLNHPQEGFTNCAWYIACVLCQLAAPGMEWNSNPGVELALSVPNLFLNFSTPCM